MPEDSDEDDGRVYAVIANRDDEYSIWPADRRLPLRWEKTGFEGTKQECLEKIGELWPDNTPLHPDR
jgi:MbtH protein